MPADAPTSSVAALLPAWQAADFIQATLDSLSAQTCDNLSVIVSVDLSDDDTYALCLAHAERDSRFLVIRQDRRLGYVGNCNFLLAQAEADYACFAFHDDLLAPDYLARLAAVLDARPEVVLAFSDMRVTHVDGRVEQPVFTALEGVQSRLQRAAVMLKPAPQWWVPNRGLFRLAAARGIGGLKIHGAGEFSTDWPWLFHMSLLGEFARVPEVLCFKHYRPGSLSRSWAFTKRQIYEAHAACLRELWNAAIPTDEKVELALPLTRRLHANPPAEAS
jgi:glycosyltransferase involved in cell wall biosynthesis